LRALAEDLRQLGNARYLAGDYGQAADGFDQLAVLLRGRLAARPDDMAASAQLATALDRLAWARSELKDFVGELTVRSENLANLLSLLQRAPGNASLQAMLADDFDRVVELILASRGNLAGSEGAVREALASARLLAAAEPPDLKRQADIAQRLKQLGDLRADAEDESGALLFYAEAAPVARRLVAAKPSDGPALLVLALILDKIGDMREADRQGALAASLEELGLSRRLVELYPGQALWRLGLALVLVKVAVRSEDKDTYIGEARALTRELESEALAPALLPWIAVLKRFVAVPPAVD
ncbi:MAG: hypothetical protein ACHQAQ_13135, partial [Hyphomicrobiales bacterium]